MDTKREFTPKMHEISGMGGGYEQSCRDMVIAGLKWLDEHPDADPKFHGFQHIYGIIAEDNKDAEDLSKAIVAACDGCTGAMHQAAVTTVMWICAHSWDEYVKEMEKEREQ